jgi:hypothetical protein
VKGGQTFVANTILGTGLPPYGILMLMMLILFVLGMGTSAMHTKLTQGNFGRFAAAKDSRS